MQASPREDQLCECRVRINTFRKSAQCCSIFSSVWNVLRSLYKNPMRFSIFVLVYCSTRFGVLCKCHLASLPLPLPSSFILLMGMLKWDLRMTCWVMYAYCQSITRLFNFVVGSVFRMWYGVKSGQIWMPYGWRRQQYLKFSAKFEILFCILKSCCNAISNIHKSSV